MLTFCIQNFTPMIGASIHYQLHKHFSDQEKVETFESIYEHLRIELMARKNGNPTCLTVGRATCKIYITDVRDLLEIEQLARLITRQYLSRHACSKIKISQFYFR